MDTFKEGVGSIIEDERLVGIIHRDPKSGHQVFYKCTEMGLDDVCELLEKFRDGSHKVCTKNGDKPVENPTDTVLNTTGEAGQKPRRVALEE